MSAAHRVVIVGAGFGGLFDVKFLRRAPVEVTLIESYGISAWRDSA